MLGGLVSPQPIRAPSEEGIQAPDCHSDVLSGPLAAFLAQRERRTEGQPAGRGTQAFPEALVPPSISRVKAHCFLMFNLAWTSGSTCTQLGESHPF